MELIQWHEAARRRVAPTRVEDLARAPSIWHGFWRFRDWAATRIALTRQANASVSEAELRAPLERVLAWKEPPNEASVVELEVFLALMGVAPVAELLAQRYGAKVIGPLVTNMSLDAKWDSTISASAISRVKQPPHEKVLRAILVRTDEEGRAACKAAATPLWNEGDVALHEALAFAFFFDDAWRAQTLREVLEHTALPFANTQIALARDAATVRELLGRRTKQQDVEYTEIVETLGADALELLFDLASEVRGKRQHESHTLAMSLFVCERAAKHLAASLSLPATRSVIGDYFSRHPALARSALPSASQGASRNAALAKALMLKVCPPEAHADEGVQLDDPAIPDVLRDAPWTNLRAPLPNLEIDLSTWPATVDLPERRVQEGLAWLEGGRGSAPEMTAAEAEAYVASAGREDLGLVAVDDKAIPFDVLLRLYCEGRWNSAAYVAMLAKFGAAALPGVRLLSSMRQLPDDVLAGIDDPFLAYALARDVIEGARTEDVPHWDWFLTHPRTAAAGLLAVAHVPDHAGIASVVLRRMARAGLRDVILAIAAQTQHADAVRALLDRDPKLDVLPVGPTNGQGASRPRLRDGRVVSAAVLERVLEILTFTLVDEPYAGLEDVKRAFDSRSLAEMAWDLAALADGGGRRSLARNFQDWMRWSLRLFADDEVIRRITPALKHATVYRVLESFARAGVRSAMIEIATAYERGDAQGSLKRVARTLDKSAFELAETMLPTTHLEDEGTTTLAYGSRTLRVGFDTTLAPILFLGEKRLASLPRAKADDDPIAIRLAREQWEELKEDVRAIGHLRARSLEDAMRTARRISAARFEADWARHPLGKHQARGIVWAVERSGALVTFRVAEDSSLADVDDHALVLGDSDFVRVPHPAELAPALRDRWSQIMTDYGLIQPVPQLARTPLSVTAEESRATTIERALVTPIPSSLFERIVREQGFSGNRQMIRCKGKVWMTPETQWTSRKYAVTKVTCTFRDDAPIALDAVHPVERAEALFVMRLVTEAVA